MCKDPRSTAASLMAAIEPDLKLILSFTGKSNTPEGEKAIAAYDAALLAVQTWKNGTPAQTVLLVLTDFQTAFNAVFPSTDTTLTENERNLVNIILAGVITVLGVIEANSPAPVAPKGMAATRDTPAMHQAAVIHETAVKVTSLVPGFKQSKWHSPTSQYEKVWNEAAAKVPGLPLNPLV